MSITEDNKLTSSWLILYKVALLFVRSSYVSVAIKFDENVYLSNEVAIMSKKQCNTNLAWVLLALIGFL